MTIPGRDGAHERAEMKPARRGRDRLRPGAAAATEPGVEADDADLQRGLAAAVLAAMGRTQLRLDAIARQQTEAHDEIRARLAALEAGIARLADPERRL
ncbi:MAG: hypothetical protein QOI82_1557 [Actinomycetota bacterium]|jgi:hypothetical protein|nr:hypothetical protein [Actinomycetota bacterium]